MPAAGSASPPGPGVSTTPAGRGRRWSWRSRPPAGHGQDIAIPLGRALDLPLTAAAVATAHAATLGWPVFDRHRLRGIRLRATDIDWHHGTGHEVLGPIAALLLLVTGRTARSHELAGPGLTPLLARLTNS